MFSVNQNSCNLSLILLYFVCFLTLLLLSHACSPLLIRFYFGGDDPVIIFSSNSFFYWTVILSLPANLPQEESESWMYHVFQIYGLLLWVFFRMFLFDSMGKLVFGNCTKYCSTYVFWDFWADCYSFPSLPLFHPPFHPSFFTSLLPTYLMFLRSPSWLVLCSPPTGHILKLLL